jgi:predicted flap endonuclease-1-like 5' DNA nuclease/1,2-phenylacetyl-CoA epoxidase PaaB subunit
VIREKEDALANARKALNDRENELSQWKKKFSDLQSSQSQSASSAAGREAAKVKELEARYQGTIREKDAALARMLAQIGELEPLKGKIAESERLVAKAAGDAAEREAARIKELEARYQETIREKDAALARMLAQIGELEPLKGRAAEAERLSAKLKELEQLTGLPARLAAAESRIATLIEERDAALQAAKASPSRSARPSKAADDSNDPNRPDDLKKIKGIGPVLEKKLASIGVVSFEQIARWTPDEADAVQKQLPELKDRIRRDNWVVAAREEFSRKYNREL